MQYSLTVNQQDIDLAAAAPYGMNRRPGKYDPFAVALLRSTKGAVSAETGYTSAWANKKDERGDYRHLLVLDYSDSARQALLTYWETGKLSPGNYSFVKRKC